MGTKKIGPDYFSKDIEEFLSILSKNQVEFWGGVIPGVLSSNDFRPGEIIQFGIPPNRIDLLNQIDGVSFAEAWENRVELSVILSSVTFPLNYIGKAELRKNKLASGRPKDLQDLEFLDK